MCFSLMRMVGARISSFSCLGDRQCDFTRPQQSGSAIHRVFQVLPQQGKSPPEEAAMGKESPTAAALA